MRAGKRRYQAFISYAHSDQEWAIWLQRVLERYSVPRKLRRERPELPQRLFPVFRDQTELASSSDLSEAIVGALGRSEQLIVICSPAAAASRWVNEEIYRFRSQSPSRPVLCLLVEGSHEPESVDCGFPPALLAGNDGQPRLEPLAADPRQNADGKTGARYKMIAGMLGVGVDRLLQRDQQRRHRLIGAFGTAGFVLAAIMTVLAWNAINSQREAELRRDQAEELIEFMLVDLRDQLEPIGRLNLLDSVGQQAMEYFQELGSLGTEEERLSRAMALRQIGEVRVGQGKLDEANVAFEHSKLLVSELVSSNPDSPHYLFEAGQSEFWVGAVHWERAQFEQALKDMEQYRQISLELNRRWPGNANYRMELTYSDQNLAALYLEFGDHERALQHIRLAIENQRALVAVHPDNREYLLELANALSWLGSTLRVRRELESSVAVFSEAKDYLAALNERGNDALVAAALCDSTLMLATGYLLVGDYEVAADQFKEAGDLYRILVGGDAANALWQEGLARAHIGLGDVLFAQADTAKSSAEFHAALAILRVLVDDDASNVTFGLWLTLTQASLAHSLVLQGDTLAASRHSDIARGMATKWAGGAAIGTTGKLRLVLAWDHIGVVEHLLGDSAAALADWEHGLEVLGEATQESLVHQAVRVRLLYRLGKAEEATGLAQEVFASGLKYSGYLPVIQ